MKNWLYSVLFRDNSLVVDDQDHEWCACIVIEAESLADAKEWGDKLSTDYLIGNTFNEFIKSDVEVYVSSNYSEVSNLPFIKYGYLAPESEIGW